MSKKYTIEDCKRIIEQKNYQKQNEPQINEEYEKFQAEYSPGKLKEVKDEEILTKLFLCGNDSNMCNKLEYKLDNLRFGSCAGTASSKYTVYRSRKTKIWQAMPYNGDKIVGATCGDATENQAKDVAKLTRDYFTNACEVISKFIEEKKLTTIEGYYELNVKLSEIKNSERVKDKVFFYKYIHMIFPEYFGTFFTKKFQKPILDCVQSDYIYVKGVKNRLVNIGEIALLSKDIGITTSQFQVFAHKEILNVSERNDSEDSDSDFNDYKEDDCTYNINTILYGPPGTGKTYRTVEMAYKIIVGEDGTDYEEKHEWFNEEISSEAGSHVAFITFHQSYGYEEFIEGIRPAINNNDKQNSDIEYKFYNGVFKAFCKEAGKEENQEQNYVFIIDEINRGNISKIFGELITLIEKTKREGADEEMSVTLPYTKDQFSVPQNVYIIGTMNTADRSIAMIDTALRRRFRFEEMMPKPELLKNITVDGVNIKKLLEKINKRIVYLYDREHQIGHSFFMELKNGDSIDKLKDVFQYNIIPLLQEYFYEDYEKIALVLGCSKKDGFIKKVDADIEDIFGKEQKDSSVLSDYDNGNTYELNDIKDFKEEWINRIINPDLNSENNEAQQESETGQESSEPDEEDDNSQE